MRQRREGEREMKRRSERKGGRERDKRKKKTDEIHEWERGQDMNC